MDNLEIEWNYGALSKIFKSDEMVALLQDKTNAIAAAANWSSSQDNMYQMPFGSKVKVLSNTAVGTAYSITPHGHNAKERLLDNIHAGG